MAVVRLKNFTSFLQWEIYLKNSYLFWECQLLSILPENVAGELELSNFNAAVTSVYDPVAESLNLKFLMASSL